LQGLGGALDDHNASGNNHVPRTHSTKAIESKLVT
jgi:hypothetical protein